MSKKKELPKKQVFTFTCKWTASIQGEDVRLYSPRMLDRNGRGLKIRLRAGITWKAAAKELRKFSARYGLYWTSVKVRGFGLEFHVSSNNTPEEIRKFANALARIQ